MNHAIVIYQLATLLVGVVSTTMALCLHLVEAAPLTKKFVVATSVLNLYSLLVGIAAYLIRVAGAFDATVETAFSVANFLLFSLLIPTWTSFFFELVQKPFSGPVRGLSRALALGGALVPLVVLLLPLGTVGRAAALRGGLYGAYAVGVLGYFLGLTVWAFLRAPSVHDAWKRRTLRGVCVLVWVGAPGLLVDALWPWLQTPGGWLPRALNVQGVVFAALGVFFASGGRRCSGLRRGERSLRPMTRPRRRPFP